MRVLCIHYLCIRWHIMKINILPINLLRPITHNNITKLLRLRNITTYTTCPELCTNAVKWIRGEINTMEFRMYVCKSYRFFSTTYYFFSIFYLFVYCHPYNITYYVKNAGEGVYHWYGLNRLDNVRSYKI